MASALPQTVASARVQSLKARHAAIEAELHEHIKSPSVSDIYLTQLKKEKLQVKEQLEGIS